MYVHTSILHPRALRGWRQWSVLRLHSEFAEEDTPKPSAHGEGKRSAEKAGKQSQGSKRQVAAPPPWWDSSKASGSQPKWQKKGGNH